MESIKILSGGFLNENSIINNELVKQNKKLLESNNEFYDSKNFNLVLPKINTIKQLTILKAIVDEYKNEISYDEKLVISYEKDLNSIKIEQSKELIFAKYAELKKLNTIISRYCSDIEVMNQLQIKKGTLDKDESKRLAKATDEYKKYLPKKLALESEIASNTKLTTEEIAILEEKINCKKETNDKKESTQKSIEDKKKLVDKINNFIEENLDIDKLKEKLAIYQDKDKSIKLLLEQNDKYKLFSDIINYLTNNPIYAETDIKKEKNIAVYPGLEDIKCDGLDLTGKFIGWFVSQRNKILKEYGKDINDKKLGEYCSKIELINDLKNINITDGEYINKYNKINYNLLVKDKYKNYESIFDTIVTFSSWSDNNFAGLYEKRPDGSLINFIIYESTIFTTTTNTVFKVYHEIFRSAENIKLTDNYYEFDRYSYQFKLTTPKGSENKTLVYPVFQENDSDLCGSLIDGIMLYSNFIQIEKLLRYYKFIFEIKVFDKWINKYGVFTDLQFIPHNSPNILTTFILSNNFDLYFDILLNFNYSIGYLISSKNITVINDDEDIDTNETYLDIVKAIEIEEYEESSKLINESIDKIIKEEFGTVSIENIDVHDSLCDKIFELLKIIILKNKNIEVEGLFIIINKLKEIKSINSLIYDLINSFIFVYHKINSTSNRNILVNTYNFSKLNYLFSLFKKDFSDQSRINSRLIEFNNYVNLTDNQVFSLFFIELVEEAIFFFKTWWLPKKQMNKLHFSVNDEFEDDRTISILNKKCLLDILCSFYFQQIYDNNKVSSLINYKLQFIKLNISMGNIKSSKDIDNSYITVQPSQFGDISKQIFNTLYKYIFTKMNGYKAYSYREENFYYYFNDPRKDEKASKVTQAGRPMCGEITIMNFLNFLLFNETEKKIDFNYLPQITQRENKELTNFYKKYNDISQYNKNPELISNFFGFMINIPVEMISGIDNLNVKRYFDRDYGDYNIPCIYRYHTTKNIGGKDFINEGVELRVTYFNLLRILSFILKLDGDLELRKIEENRNNDTFIKNSLLEIIKLFQNPNITNITKDYTISYDKDDPIYSYYNPIEITLSGATISLAGHSEFNLTSITNKNFRKIKKLLMNYQTIFKKINYTKEYPVDIFSSIFFALFKENNIYSEINFKYIPEEYIIKFLNILHIDLDNLYIPYNIIKDLIEYKKTKVLRVIFDKFSFPTRFYHLYLTYLIVNGIDFNINEILKSYFLKYNRVYSDLFTAIISYNNIEVVKNIIDAKRNILKYHLWAIKTKEMFDLLDSSIPPTISKIKFYHIKITSSIFINKPTKFEFIDSTIFKNILKKNIDYYESLIFNDDNVSKDLIEKISKLDPSTVQSIIKPEMIFSNVCGYELLKIVKLKLPYYNYESDENLSLLISNNYKKLISNQSARMIQGMKIKSQIDILNLLCYTAELNKTLFLEQILCAIFEFRKNNRNNNSPVILSKTHLLSEYMTHKFYDNFSEIFNSLNIYSFEYAYLCEAIFRSLAFEIKAEILKVKFKKINDKSEIKIIEKIIEEYPKLYEKNLKTYSINMYKLYGSKYLPRLNVIGLNKFKINQLRTEFIFESYNRGIIELYMLLNAYYGTDEFTDFLISNLTKEKINTTPIILSLILNRYDKIGLNNDLVKIASNLTKKDSKYTKEYICKNMIKLLNVVILRIDESNARSEVLNINILITRFCNNINQQNTFLIKCIKNIINADKLNDPKNNDKMKAIIDRRIKKNLIDLGINIVGKGIISLVALFKNEDLNIIVKKLDMK